MRAIFVDRRGGAATATNIDRNRADPWAVAQSDSMNILVAHNFYQQPGGEDQCVAAEIEMLKSGGHKVIQYQLHNDSIKSLHPFALASRTIWSQPAFVELRAICRQYRPQIAHFHNTFPLISPAGYYAARAEGARVVQTLHNFRLLCSNALLFRDGHVCEDCVGRAVPWPGIVHKCYRDSRAATAVVTAMLTAHRAIGTWRRAVDVYITLTDFVRRKLVAGGVPAGKIAVKSNFVDPDPGPGSGSGKYAVFAGRLSEEKGLELLLEGWNHLGSQLPLKIIGDGPLAHRVKQAAQRDSAIEWLGSMRLEAVYEAIGHAAVLVLPSTCYEAFPRVIVEAFAKGTPVLASGHGAMATIINEGSTGMLFRPGDAYDLAEKMKAMLKDAKRLGKMRQAAREQFIANYSAENNYRTLMSVYDNVLTT